MARVWSDEEYQSAKQLWDEERERLRGEVGLTAAEEAHRDASVAACEARDLLANMRAKTLAGLVFKAECAASFPMGDCDHELVASIVEDLLAMAEADHARARATLLRSPILAA